MVKLIKANFRKDKAILSIFLLIIIFSALLMHTGLLASMYPRLFDEYAERGGLADFFTMTDADAERISSIFGGDEGVERYVSEEAVNIPSVNITTDKCTKSKESSGWFVQHIGDKSGYDELEFVERDDSVGGKKIYLNLYTASSCGASTGDTVYLDTTFGKFEYTVAGIYQHLYMGNSYYYLSAFVEDDGFDELSAASQAAGIKGYHLVFVNCKEDSRPEECLNRTTSALRSDKDVYAYGHTQKLSRSGYPIIVNILAGFIAAFALIIMVICIIMIVFTINNNISRDIANIGALRAVGHTVGQIRGALTGEYVLLGLVGSVTGIVLSYILFPIAERTYLRELSGIIWDKRAYPLISGGVIAGTLIVIVLAAFFATRKICRLHPTTALRFGLSAHSFRKNHLPLSKTGGELNLLLALKSSLQNIAQNVIILIIVLAVSFVTMFSGVLYYNTKVDITMFQRMIQGDAPDAYICPKDTSYESSTAMIERIKDVEGVSEAYGLSAVPAVVGEGDISLIYVSDPDFVYCGIYDGEIMREDNEAVVGSVVADRLGIGVGDEIEVHYGEAAVRYLVTGLQQSVTNERVYVTDKGAQRLGVDTQYGIIRVRVEDASAERVDDVIARIESLEDGALDSTENYYRYQRSNDNTPVYAVGFIVLLLIVLNAATVLLVIRLLLKTVFVKRHKEFGIMKAVGFTSLQLRYQLSLSLMPTTIAAAFAGAAVGFFIIEPMFTFVLGGYGVKDADLLIPPVLILLTAAAVSLLVFVLSLAMSGRMKKISAYELIQE